MVGNGQRLFEVVRDVNDRNAARLEVMDDLEQHFDFRSGQRRSRLVHDQDACIDGQRTRDLDDLLLTEAQVLDLGQRIDVLFQFFKQFAGLALFFCEIDTELAADFAAHEDIVAHGHVRCERQLLVNDADTALLSIRSRVQLDRFAVEDNGARGRLLHARQDFHQRGFTGAVLTEQRGDLTAVDVEVHTLQCTNGTKGFGHVTRSEHNLALRLCVRRFVVDRSLHYCTSRATGVISQFFGLMRVNAPVTSTVLPVRFSRSRSERASAAIARLMPEPAS